MADNNTASKKYRFLTKPESDKLKKIMSEAGGYYLFMERWTEENGDKRIPSLNSYYNVLNGRSLKKEVVTLIMKIVDETTQQIKELQKQIKTQNDESNA